MASAERTSPRASLRPPPPLHPRQVERGDEALFGRAALLPEVVLHTQRIGVVQQALVVLVRDAPGKLRAAVQRCRGALVARGGRIGQNRRVLVHQRQQHVVAEALVHEAHDALRVLEGSRQHEVAHHRPANEARIPVHLVELRGAGLAHHLAKGGQRCIRVVRRLRVTRRQQGIGVLEVGEVHVHGTCVRLHGRHRLVARGVPHHGKRQPPPTRPRHGGARLQGVVRGRDEVDVQRALRLQLQEHLRQPVHVYGAPRLASGYHGVLAVAAV